MFSKQGQINLSFGMNCWMLSGMQTKKKKILKRSVKYFVQMFASDVEKSQASERSIT